MSHSKRSDERRGNLIEDGDQNNLIVSHNQHNISQQQNFGGGGLTVVQEQQMVAQPCLQWTSRLQWTQHHHNCFVDAVNKLGGPGRAKPKAILKEMAIEGLTLAHVKSYLQRFRNGKITDISNLPRRPGRRSNRPGMGDENGAGPSLLYPNGNIQQPAQDSTASTPDNMETPEDPLEYYFDFDGYSRQDIEEF